MLRRRVIAHSALRKNTLKPSIVVEAARKGYRITNVLGKQMYRNGGNRDINERVRAALQASFLWYKKMLHPETDFLVYEAFPQSETFRKEGNPIREIGAIWDIELLSNFLSKNDFNNLITKWLEHYMTFVVPFKENEKCLILDSRKLREPSTIAHSAFMILCLAHYHRLTDSIINTIRGLSEGLLYMQRQDGLFHTQFTSKRDEGQTLYPGEAMLALIQAYEITGDVRYMKSVEKGFGFYKNYFHNRRISEDSEVFFANWMSQSLSRLAKYANEELTNDIKNFLLELHDRIIESGFYEEIIRNPTDYVTVEVACALEGIAHAYPFCDDKRRDIYKGAISSASEFLLNLQWKVGKFAGGFGNSVSHTTQRIDVTGHVVNAFVKVIQNVPSKQSEESSIGKVAIESVASGLENK